jgi:hypothetical protein
LQRCPTCNRTYPDDAPPFCPQDATRLVNDAAASNLPTTMVSPSYGNAPQQQYAPQQYPAPQQQWGAPPVNRGGNKTLLLVIVGLVVVVGVGLTVYFLTRSGSSSTSGTSSGSGSKSSTASNPFVGTWVMEGQDPNNTLRFTEDGKFYENWGVGEKLRGTYTVNGNRSTITTVSDVHTEYATLESDNRVKWEGDSYIRK